MFVCPTCATTYQTDNVCPNDGTLPLNAASDALLGTTIGSYRIAAKVGSGGMGTVYRAMHPNIGSRVAIKVLSHDSARDRDAVNRFFDEARTVNLIRHDNIVNILDVARLPDGRPYIVMEMLDGVSLKSILRQGPVAVPELGRITVTVLDALAAAHEHGIAHRDLKPDNVMISPSGRVTLVDFGIAKIASTAANVITSSAAGESAGIAPGAVRTQTGVILGTPQYMSPEQAQGRSVDARTDIYAMGVMMYEMVTGVRPFEGDSLFEILRQQITVPPRPPSQLAVVPADLEQIILLALAKAPEQRFANARAMQAAVRHATGLTLQAARWPHAATAPSPARPVVVAAATNTAATAPLQVPQLVASDSPPPAHASSFSMIAKSAKSGNRTRKSTWLIAAAGVAIIAGVAIPVLRGRQPASVEPLPPTGLQRTGGGNAAVSAAGNGPIQPVDFAAVAALSAAATPPSTAPPANTAAPNTASLKAAIKKITSREEYMIAVYAKDPLQNQAAQAVMMAQADPAAPFVENDRLEIAIDGFAAYAYGRARSLEPDAQLVAIEFNGVRQNGLITAKGGFGSASATFFSPHKLIRPATVKPDVAWTPLAILTIAIGHAGVVSQISWITNDEPLVTLPLPKCKPSQLWRKQRQHHPTVDKFEKTFGLQLGYRSVSTWTRNADFTELSDDCN